MSLNNACDCFFPYFIKRVDEEKLVYQLYNREYRQITFDFPDFGYERLSPFSIKLTRKKLKEINLLCAPYNKNEKEYIYFYDGLSHPTYSKEYMKKYMDILTIIFSADSGIGINSKIHL